ncbi:MAG: hypothetical protein KF688_08115 [Pirellulales bacterium]|nr:hypothetical protein [Pirellulales bacterium]
MRSLAAAAIIVASCSASLAQDASVDVLVSQAEEPIQEQLQLVAEAMAPSNPSLRERVASLHDAIADKNEIVKQIAIYAAAPGEGQPLIALGLLQTLEIPPSVVIRMLAPYLDAENKNLRSFVRDWFQGHDNAGPTSSQNGPVNYGDYFEYVRERTVANQNVPTPFVEYMFERSPGEALLIFNKADNLDGSGRPGRARPRDDVTLAEHVVSNALWFKQHRYEERFQAALPDAKNELSKLGSHEHWWVRLYVVQIMRRHPEFREPVVLARLASDGYAPVSEIAKSLR